MLRDPWYVLWNVANVVDRGSRKVVAARFVWRDGQCQRHSLIARDFALSRAYVMVAARVLFMKTRSYGIKDHA